MKHFRNFLFPVFDFQLFWMNSWITNSKWNVFVLSDPTLVIMALITNHYLTCSTYLQGQSNDLGNDPSIWHRGCAASNKWSSASHFWHQLRNQRCMCYFIATWYQWLPWMAPAVMLEYEKSSTMMYLKQRCRYVNFLPSDISHCSRLVEYECYLQHTYKSHRWHHALC